MNQHSDEEFQVDPWLGAECEFVTDTGLCRLLLMNNASVPWFILVPKRVGVTELTSLPMEQQQQVLQEINQVAAMITSLYTPFKLNIGAIGNVVSQLHIHVVGRFEDDVAWPRPVWGILDKNDYSPASLEALLVAARAYLNP